MFSILTSRSLCPRILVFVYVLIMTTRKTGGLFFGYKPLLPATPQGARFHFVQATTAFDSLLTL